MEPLHLFLHKMYKDLSKNFVNLDLENSFFLFYNRAGLIYLLFLPSDKN